MGKPQLAPCPELIALLKALRIDLTQCVSGEITIKFGIEEIIELNVKTKNWAIQGDMQAIGEFIDNFELHRKEE
jgi:hypothetical protein